MLRKPLSEIDGHGFDVIVIGAGVNGSAAAQHLAEAGYSVLIVDKADYASGASGNSSRLLSCGIRYLAPNRSVWEFVGHPLRFLHSLKNAREHMLARSEFLRTNTEQIRRIQFAVPVYRTDNFKPWQVRLGFKLLWQLGKKDIPLDYRFVPASEASGYPLLATMRESDLRGFFLFREHYFDWPERFVMDMVLDAQRLGAIARNYTRVVGMRRIGEEWSVDLHDELQTASRATVRGKIVLNLAGAWLDEVARLAPGQVRRRVAGAKGVHVAVRLGKEYEGQGVMGYDRSGKYFYCFPWRDYHCFGPTWTRYEGSADTTRPTSNEIDYILNEAKYLFPGLGTLDRDSVHYAWAGVRPLTHDERQPEPQADRTIHDFGADGMPNLFGLTAGLLKSHRIAAREIRKLIGKRLRPSRDPGNLSFSSVPFSADEKSPHLIPDWSAREADISRAAIQEHATSIDDAFRRTGINWTEWMGLEAAERTSHLLANALSWSEPERQRQLDAFLAHLAMEHAVSQSRISKAASRVAG